MIEDRKVHLNFLQGMTYCEFVFEESDLPPQGSEDIELEDFIALLDEEDCNGG